MMAKKPAIDLMEIGLIRRLVKLTFFQFILLAPATLFFTLAAISIGGGRLVGPDLKGVTIRRDRDWLISFITSPDQLIAREDPLANQLVQEYGMPMPNLGLSEQEAEEVLFPELERHDIVEPPQIFRLDHVEFRERKQGLYQLAYNPQDYDFSKFKSKVIESGEYLTKELESHIFKEDNILYQIALQVLSPEEWEEVKKKCDKLGYCCFTPGDQKKEEKQMVELDLRSIMPFERHEKIFQMWDALSSGETLKITNDHDPKPLHYQFEAEYKNQYEWEYEQEGPKDWIVKLKKI